MRTSKDSLLEQAKQLSAEDKCTLIDVLHDLNTPPDLELDAAWPKECNDRLAALERGEMKTYDFGEVLANALARLKRI